MRKSRIMPGWRAFASRYCCIIGVVIRRWSLDPWPLVCRCRPAQRLYLLDPPGAPNGQGQMTKDQGLFGAVALPGHGDGTAVVGEGDLGHVVADQEQAAAAGAFEVLRRGRVGDVLGVEARALVSDAD